MCLAAVWHAEVAHDRGNLEGISWERFYGETGLHSLVNRSPVGQLVKTDYS